jgi:hypothetical protein
MTTPLVECTKCGYKGIYNFEIRDGLCQECSTSMEDKLEGYIFSIRDWLRNLAEDRTLPMDVQVHTALWREIQTIDLFIEELKKQENKSEV